MAYSLTNFQELLPINHSLKPNLLLLYEQICTGLDSTLRDITEVFSFHGWDDITILVKETGGVNPFTGFQAIMSPENDNWPVALDINAAAYAKDGGLIVSTTLAAGVLGILAIKSGLVIPFLKLQAKADNTDTADSKVWIFGRKVT